MSEDRRGDPVDVRIVVEGASDVEVISRALQRMALGGEFHVTVTSVIPTTHAHIAEKAAEGADVVIIATDADKPGRKLAKKLAETLKGKVGTVERMKLPLGHDVEHVDLDLVVKELRNAIVRAGLRSLPEIKELRERNEELETRVEELEAEVESLSEELEKREETVEELEERLKELEAELTDCRAEKGRLEELVEELEEEKERLEGEIRELKSRLREMVVVAEREEVGVPEDVDPGLVEAIGSAMGVPVVIGAERVAFPSREDLKRVLEVYRRVIRGVSRGLDEKGDGDGGEESEGEGGEVD